MERVEAYKGINMSKPRVKEIEFELKSGKKVSISFDKVLLQGYDVLSKNLLKLNKNYHPSLEVYDIISDQIYKIRKEWMRNLNVKDLTI